MQAMPVTKLALATLALVAAGNAAAAHRTATADDVDVVTVKKTEAPKKDTITVYILDAKGSG